MDLALYGRILWRFRALVLAGTLLASVAGLLTVVDPELKDGITLNERNPRVWEARGTLLVNQSGFPLGRSTLSDLMPAEVNTADPAEESQLSLVPRFTDLSRFVQLAQIYAQLAISDRVRQTIRRDGPLRGAYTVSAAESLPILAFRGVGKSPATAVVATQRAMVGLTTYIREEQQASRVPTSNRVELTTLDPPRRAVDLSGRPKTLPAIAFVSIFALTLLLAFALDNLRPRVRAVPEDGRSASERARLSA